MTGGRRKKKTTARLALLKLRRAERRLLRRGKKSGSKWLRRDLIFPTGREEVCRGMAVGMFWACAPMPMQMAPALLFCWLSRANIVLAMACVWLSNPFTYLPVFYLEYRIGEWLFGGGGAFTFANFKALWDGTGGADGALWGAFFSGILKPLLQGALVLAIVMAVAGYAFGFIVHGFLHRHSNKKGR
ncbi:MAG: DUF2062 domain-containing protein [Gammaproteobacteria bacterium]